LEDAASAASKGFGSKVAALVGGGGSGGASAPAASRAPPASARLAPLAAAGGSGQGGSGQGGSGQGGAAGSSVSSPKSAAAASPSTTAVASPKPLLVPQVTTSEKELQNMSTDEIIKLTLKLAQERNDVKQQLEMVQHFSGSGHPAAAAAASAKQAPALVVEFAEPRHQQRPSMIAASIEQIR
jgi:hypothetical protein